MFSTENIYSDVNDDLPYSTDHQPQQNGDTDHVGLGQRFPSKRGREVNQDWDTKPLNVSLPELGDGKGNVTDDASYLSPCQGTPPPGYHELLTKSTPVLRPPAASCQQANLSVESIYLTPISDEEAEELEQEKKGKKRGKERPGVEGKRNGSFVDDDCYLAPRSCQVDTDDGATDDGYLAPVTCRIAVEDADRDSSPTRYVNVANSSDLTTPAVDTPTLATPIADTPTSETGVDTSSPSNRNTIYAIRELPPAPPVPDTPVPDT